MDKRSTQIALGGVFSALCLLVMFMTGLVPFLTYIMPAVAGTMLRIVVVENGPKVAAMVYVSVAVLSVFIVPDREAALMFVCFFGYYPIMKGYLEKIRVRPVKIICKAALFNIAVVGAYLAANYLLGMQELLRESGAFGEYTLLFLLVLGNIFFICYDISLTYYTNLYVHWFKPKFLRK